MPLLSNAQKQAAPLAILIIAMVVSILCSFLLAWYAANRATSSRATVQELCISGNDNRSQQIRLWEFVLSLSTPQSSDTAAERATQKRNVRQFRIYLHKVFAPRDCTKITGR
jgi:phage-related minor tail protein